MYFTKLPDDVRNAVIELTRDQVFQQRFATDKVLDDLEAQKYNPQDEYFALMTVLNGKFLIGDIEVKVFSPALWSFLYISGSPFVTSGTPKDSDVDFIVYLMDKGLNDAGSDPEEIFEKSLGYCHLKGIDYLEATKAIIRLIQISFRPLKMFPSVSHSDKQPRFDADWLTSTVAKVHEVTGLSPKEIMYDMTLTECCYYYAQYARKQGATQIEMRTNQELCVEMGKRAVEMILDRLLEINKIELRDVELYREIMNTPPEEKQEQNKQ